MRTKPPKAALLMEREASAGGLNSQLVIVRRPGPGLRWGMVDGGEVGEQIACQWGLGVGISGA